MKFISLETEEIETDYEAIVDAILKEDGYDVSKTSEPISYEPGDLADQLQRERARSEALQKDRDDWKSKYDALASVDSHGKLYQAGLIDQSRYTQLANQTQAQLNAQYAEFRRDLNSYWGQALGSQFYRKE